MLADRLYGRASTDDVVQSVRRLRAERDQLRLRDRDHSRSMRQVGHRFCMKGFCQGEGLHLRRARGEKRDVFSACTSVKGKVLLHSVVLRSAMIRVCQGGNLVCTRFLPCTKFLLAAACDLFCQLLSWHCLYL